MFTGIITDIGQILTIRRETGGASASQWGDTRMRVACHYDVAGIATGASIAHNGACMTVVEKGQLQSADTDYPCWYSFDVSDESLAKTTMKNWRAGDKINLERALTGSDELGGHLVTGHVDNIGALLEIEKIAGSKRLRFSAPDTLMTAIAPKGSVVVDGVSLTVNDVGPNWFEVNIIPHTAQVTTLGALEKDNKVNLEIDLIARYVTRYLQAKDGKS